MITYIIIDDEHVAHDIIKGYCDKLPNMQLTKHCYDAFEALDYLREKPIDLIFLDLNIPKLKGFEFLRTLPHAPKVIVTTAYTEYAVEGYELEIADYLLKPFSFERFLKAVNKALHSKSHLTSASRPPETNDSGRIFLRNEKKYVQVAIGDILFIEGTPVMWQGPVANWIKACRLIEDMDVESIVPGHGPITDKKGVMAVRHYLEYVHDQARLRYNAGMSAFDAAKDIELSEYSSWSDPERIAVNVDSLYREFSGEEMITDVVELFTRMAELAGFGGADTGSPSANG